jgi:hypothetical protein
LVLQWKDGVKFFFLIIKGLMASNLLGRRRKWVPYFIIVVIINSVCTNIFVFSSRDKALLLPMPLPVAHSIVTLRHPSHSSCPTERNICYIKHHSLLSCLLELYLNGSRACGKHFYNMTCGTTYFFVVVFFKALFWG